MDWERRLVKLTDLAGKKLLSHQIVDGKIDGKVPLTQVVDRAESLGLEAIVDGDRLHITRLHRTRS
jgi:hypothetical protein